MITGQMLRDAIISAANNITALRRQVDAMNVFPVPDGDTGTNMSLTIQAAAREVGILPDDASIDLVSQTVSSALLRGARGNSGVILSLIFRGVAKSFKGQKTADAAVLAAALKAGTDSAYNAVMKPTEGTILTVVRVAAEKAAAAAKNDTDVLAAWDAACAGAVEALAKTPEQLPVLKKAGVVDAGGQGLVYIFDGMSAVFHNNTIVSAEPAARAETEMTHAAAHADTTDITYTYCTEFIVNRKDPREPLPLRAYLESIGDSVVVVDDEDIIKVHLHTDEPGNAIEAAQKYGPLVNIKIDNMRQQHRDVSWGVADRLPPEETDTLSPAEPEKPFGVVAVAVGDGVETLFRDIGADNIVSGGQTMNPSTEDILKAVSATPAEHIFVLPNNKNIIMAAEQVIPLTEKKVHVLHTRSIPQGIAALLTLDPDIGAEENHLQMMKAADKVGTGLVTFAARDSQIGGEKVKKGQILGMENGKITVVDNSPVQAAYKVTKHLFKRGTSSLVTIFYGDNATAAQADELAQLLTAKYDGDAEITVIDGGQPVYYFIIAVE